MNTQSDNFILRLRHAGNRKTRTDKRLGTTLTYAYDNIYQTADGQAGDYNQRELYRSLS